MFSVKEIDKNNSDEIRNYLQIHTECNLSFLQLPSWAKVKSDTWNSKLIIVNQDNKPVSASLLLYKNYGKIKIGYISHGLKLREGLLKTEYYSEYLRSLKKFLLSIIDIIIIEPPFNYQNQEIFTKILGESLRNNGFQPYIEQFNPQYTSIIDLNDTEEKIFSTFKKDTRNLIRNAQKNNLTIEIGNSDKELGSFYSIMKSLENERGYIIRSKKYYKTILDEFSKQNQISIVNILKDGIVLGSSLLIFCNKVAYELYGGTSNEGKKYNVPRFLKWEDIKHAKARDCETYDQCGATITHTKSIQYQYGKFKAEFSSNFIETLPQYISAKNGLLLFLFKAFGVLRHIYSVIYKSLKKIIK